MGVIAPSPKKRWIPAALRVALLAANALPALGAARDDPPLEPIGELPAAPSWPRKPPRPEEDRQNWRRQAGSLTGGWPEAVAASGGRNLKVPLIPVAQSAEGKTPVNGKCLRRDSGRSFQPLSCKMC